MVHPVSRKARIDLRDATVLLTGATGGIGIAIARAVSARGGRLLLTGRQRDVLDGLASELGGRSLPCDLSSREDVAQLGQEAAAAGTGVLIANAAIPASGVFDELTPEQIDRMLEVNLRSPIALARAVLPGMIERGAGHVVFISSLQGKAGTPASSMYCATKFGMRGFALAAREDLYARGVGVSTVFPGFIREAGMFANSGVKLPPGVGTRSPDDVARGVLKVIDEDRAELDVAPLPLRLGTAFAGLAPGISSLVSRRFGSDELAGAVAETQRHLR
jgi:short-subunit dehydrogenase